MEEGTILYLVQAGQIKPKNGQKEKAFFAHIQLGPINTLLMGFLPL